MVLPFIDSRPRQLKATLPLTQIDSIENCSPRLFNVSSRVLGAGRIIRIDRCALCKNRQAKLCFHVEHVYLAGEMEEILCLERCKQATPCRLFYCEWLHVGDESRIVGIPNIEGHGLAGSEDAVDV